MMKVKIIILILFALVFHLNAKKKNEISPRPLILCTNVDSLFNENIKLINSLMEGGKTDTIFVMRIKKKKWRREMDRLNLYYFIDKITLLSDGVDFCCNPHDLFITKQHLNNLKKWYMLNKNKITVETINSAYRYIYFPPFLNDLKDIDEYYEKIDSFKIK